MRKTGVAIVILLIVGIVILSDTLFIVDETNQVLITQFGEYIRTVQDAGLHAKIPFIQKITVFEKRVLASDALETEYLTLDKKRVVVDHVTRWRITDPHEFYKGVRTEAGALARLEEVVSGRLREEIARRNFVDLVREERDEIVATVCNAANEYVKSFGVTLVDVQIKRLDLPKDVENSVFDRMQAERQRMAKQYRAEGEEEARQIMAKADKEKEIILAEAYAKSQTIRGEGDAAATAVYAEAYESDPEFYSFLKRLETYKNILPGSTLVLEADSDLFKYMISPNPDIR